MRSEDFYAEFAAIMGSEAARYPRMAALHDRIFAKQASQLCAITDAGAARLVPDGRSVAIVVAHILEWERYIITSMGEIMAGVELPGLIAHKRYVEQDGADHEYTDIDSFNALQLKRYEGVPWSTIQTRAIDSATTLLRLFTTSGLITAELLDRTRMLRRFELPDGTPLPMACGWLLWMIVLEHAGVEHAADLELGIADRVS